jgi:sirohydrochlorin ferrochelatase
MDVARPDNPTRAILLVDHGSRRSAANALLETVADAVRRRLPDRVVRIAHMEIAEPTIAQGIAACAEAGAREIVIHPYFLGPGNHTSNSIPQLGEAAMETHPDLRVKISDPLGPHPKLVDVILERVETASRS